MFEFLPSGSDEGLDVCRLLEMSSIHPSIYQPFTEHILCSRHHASSGNAQLTETSMALFLRRLAISCSGEETDRKPANST